MARQVNASDFDDCTEDIDNLFTVDNLADLGSDVQSIRDALLKHLFDDRAVNLSGDVILVPDEDIVAVSWVMLHLDRAGVEIQRETERRDIVRELGDDAVKHRGGRAPLGFVIKSGERVQGDNYDEVRETLHLVELPEGHPDKLSKRAAADRLGCSRRTINRALDRGRLYGLDD